ncbi:glycosyltransferase family 2 protein [Parabacteroides sp. FAFU027]|uniref:glycosyltransferase family 2 protein n=1 Tax=Parabacteroides sp. FAFU027 TaxID=2922715 RepID=UPI001FAF9BBE|nr:glycosyltransferase family A protein [Parabacteroides sp. FAFU027]
MNDTLAIVIPAYKGAYLPQTLDALSEQTCKDFNVYIGDDCSPDDINSIVETFRSRLNISYCRFETNLGGVSLPSHWTRSIELSKIESWIWLLPDDDVPDNNCVEEFMNEIRTTSDQSYLYRFNTRHINEKNEIIRVLPQSPRLETNIQFVFNKLSFNRNSTLAEYIFSKSKYLEVGGFYDLPLAWGSDDLLWVNLSYDYDIVTLGGASVSLRQSVLNISNNQADYLYEKFDAKYKMLNCLLGDYQFVAKLNKESSLNHFIDCIIQHLFFEYKSSNYPMSFTNILQLANRNKKLIGGSFIHNVFRLLLFKIKN